MTEPTVAIDQKQNIARLRRFLAWEEELVRLQGGWLPGLPQTEAKNEIGRQVWEGAEIAERLRGRLAELRHPAGERFPVPEPVRDLITLLSHAQNEGEFLAGLQALLAELTAGYRAHAGGTYALFDQPTVAALEEVIAWRERHLAWLGDFLARMRGLIPEGDAFAGRARAALAAMDGVHGDGRVDLADLPPSPLPFRYCRRDPRTPQWTLEEDIQPPLTDAEAHKRWRFTHYYGEMNAAESLGTVLWMTPEMPWAFRHITARHCWDEVRHSMFGQERLADWGYDLLQVPLNPMYDITAALPPVEHYAVTTLVMEPGGMPEKDEMIRRYSAQGDDVSTQAVTYDRTDEAAHVGYGRQWTPVLLEAYGYDETVEELIPRLAAWLGEHSFFPGHKADKNRIVAAAMANVRQGKAEQAAR